MSVSEFFLKIVNGNFWANLLGMFVVVVLVALGVRYGIDFYTHHGESIVVPNVRHKSFDDAEKLLKKLGLVVQVGDTGYVKTLPPDCILEQSPEAGKRVKSGRIIYLTVNASHTPTLTLPDVVDNGSLREVVARLKALGFKVGTPQYVPGEKDWVYGVLVRGKHVSAGTRISVEETLIIQAGNGMIGENDSILMLAPIYEMEEESLEEEEPEVIEEENVPEETPQEEPAVP